jgi:hypothetical protein
MATAAAAAAEQAAKETGMGIARAEGEQGQRGEQGEDTRFHEQDP